MLAGLPDSMGPYQLIEVLGRGGMGVVFRGYDPVIGRPVAIKVIRRHEQLSPDLDAELKRRFDRDSRTVSGSENAPDR
jgi:serine/threonine protein kinase